MSKNLYRTLPVLVALMLTAIMGSCKSDSTYEETTSNSCVMASATLGTLNRYIYMKTSAGTDSTYISHVTGSLYPLSIDQLDGRIFNPDSLPVNTDVSKVVFSVLNATGSMTIKSLYTGQDTLVSTKDTLDCRGPRLLTVHGTDGVSSRTYTIDIRVHKEAGDSVLWQREGVHADLAAATAQKAIVSGSSIYVFANIAGQPAVLYATTDAPASLSRTNLSRPTIDVRSIVLHRGTFYALADGELVSSQDAVAWRNVDTTLPAAFTTLPVAGSDRLVATDAAGMFYSSRDGGQTWQADETELARPMPQAQVQGVCIPSENDPTYEDLLVLGHHDGTPVVWKRNIDLTDAVQYPWVYYPETENADYVCPIVESSALAYYDGATLLLGLQDGKLATPRLSRDNGRSWDSSIIKAPEAVVSGSLSVVTTADNYIILYCGGSGEVWKGRINRLGWK